MTDEVTAKIKEPQASIIRMMVPLYGRSPQEVVRFIVTAWLHENYGRVEGNRSLARTIIETNEREERNRRGLG